jgi:hypothetical protein
VAAVDVTPYVDLTLYDVDAQTLKDRALLDALTKFPDWTPREGTVEVALIEAFAVVVDELAFAVNRVPGAVLEVLLRLYGLNRDTGAPSTSSVTFTLSDTVGHTIPAGTRLLLDVGVEEEPVELVTDVALTIPAGTTSPTQRTVTVTARGDTSAGTGITAGTPLEMLDAVPYVDAVTLAGPIIGGRDPEDGAAFLTRGSTMLTRLVSTLVTPAHFTAAAIEEAYVARAFTVDRYDPAQNPPTNRDGHVTVVAAGPAGVPLSAANKALLDAKLEAGALSILDVHLADPTISTVTVQTTITLTAGATAATVQAAAVAALDAYLDPASWPFAAAVYINELIALVDRVPGVDRVTALTVNGSGGTVTLPGAGPLVDLASATVTVA